MKCNIAVLSYNGLTPDDALAAYRNGKTDGLVVLPIHEGTTLEKALLPYTSAILVAHGEVELPDQAPNARETAIATQVRALEKLVQDTRAKCESECTFLNQQIQSLLALEHNPS